MRVSSEYFDRLADLERRVAEIERALRSQQLLSKESAPHMKCACFNRSGQQYTGGCPVHGVL